ncbi:protein FAM151B [Meleagris gallopavo]|uniref:protein FAM151B n=1 Tax=Meleagris gallopavo TaxID=9103 RepID=UPI000549DF03|nr:protein FAM151B [Meleagris gallopavo]
MVEADVLLRGGRGGDGDPIMAHPPETDSDITLQEWLEEMVSTDKGIKLDFKSLDAVRPSLELLQLVKPCLDRPVWLNADVLPGPNGISAVVDAKGFLDTVTSFFPDVTLSLGWTTGWHPERHNEVISLILRNFLEQIARALFQAVCSPSPTRRSLLTGALEHFLKKIYSSAI